VDQFPGETHRTQANNYLLKDYPFLPWKEKLTEEEALQVQQLRENLKSRYLLRVVLLFQDELVGWSFGWQESAESFYMAASLVIPTFRRKGLYTQIVKRVLAITKEKGFQTVSSSHILTNNSVIIAKLKLGFIIKGVELDPVHGSLLRMAFHHNSLMTSAARFRAGALKEPGVQDLLLR
jgi:hypothetical protein